MEKLVTFGGKSSMRSSSPLLAFTVKSVGTSKLSERAYTSVYHPWIQNLTGLVLQGISSNDSVGFCRYVPVDINTVKMSLLDPEGSGNRWYLKHRQMRKTGNVSSWLQMHLVSLRGESHLLQGLKSGCYYWAALQIDCLQPLCTSCSCCTGRGR